jgi:hypothetical protein
MFANLSDPRESKRESGNTKAIIMSVIITSLLEMNLTNAMSEFETKCDVIGYTISAIATV